jgi:putative oxidoreductase
MASIDIAHRRYIIRTLAFMAGYVAVNVAAIAGAFDDITAPGSYGLALVVAAPVAGQMWATLALMHDADEFVRRLTANRFIAAAGAAITLFSAWGFMESYADAPHVEGWLIYPLFWACFGVISPFIRTSR